MSQKEMDEYVIFNLARQDGIRRQGVAFVIEKELSNSIIDYNQYSERIISLERNTRNEIQSIEDLSCYNFVPSTTYSSQTRYLKTKKTDELPGSRQTV